MKIVVCGAGIVGGNIAQYLSVEGNDVTVIDSDPLVIRELTEEVDLKGVVGFASYPDILEAAGAPDADMIIAATTSDEVNMVVCQVAHSIFDIPNKIARLRAEAYTKAIYADMYRRDHLPVDVVISPERSVANALTRRLRKQSAIDIESFLQGDAQFIGLHIDADCPVIHTPLRQLSELFSTFAGRIVAIRRDGGLFVPTADDQIFEGDDVYLITLKKDEIRAYEIFGKTNQSVTQIVIIGGGDVGFEIAKQLESEGQNRIKMIERDQERAEFLADNLDKTVVLKGDGLDPDLLKEANIARADAALTVTDDDKINLLSAARAKAMGAKHATAIVNNPTLDDLMEPLNIDTVVNPRNITVSTILQHIRHGRIHSVYIVGQNEAEVTEAQVLATSALNGRRIRDVEWPEGTIVGALRKGDEVMIPDGDVVMQDGDWIVVFSLRSKVGEIERLFQVNVDYF